MPQEYGIYVVDDDDAVRGSICALLSAFGFDVESFDSGETFLNALSRLRNGIIVLDWRMPGCGGATVLRALDEHFFTIVHSAHLDSAAIAEARRLGAADIIEKPCEPRQLVDAVRRAIEVCRTAPGEP